MEVLRSFLAWVVGAQRLAFEEMSSKRIAFITSAAAEQRGKVVSVAATAVLSLERNLPRRDIEMRLALQDLAIALIAHSSSGQQT